MSKTIDIFLQPTTTSLGWYGRKSYQLQNLPADSKAFATALAELKGDPQLAGSDVDLYLAEDLLFFTQITLPLQTPDIKGAIDLQRDMLSPFGDDSLSAFTSQRSKDGYHVTLYFCRKSQVTPFLDVLFAAGAHLTGLYPESQRYLTRDNHKQSWSLRRPGPFGKITHFKQGKVIRRDLCSDQVSASEITQRTGNTSLYTLGNALGNEGSAMSLLAQPASARQYDMLPASYRRPDYMKKALLVLAVANLVLILLLGAGKGIALYRQEANLNHQIEASKVDAEQALALKKQINKLKKQLKNYRAMGKNIDLVAFMATLSANLPTSAYLDQLRYDQTTKTITLQGYTDDLPALTAKIPDLGTATLKSTMKRRNKTYFHMEVSIP